MRSPASSRHPTRTGRCSSQPRETVTSSPTTTWPRCTGFAPLSANPRWQRPDAALRVRAFADAYGLDEAQRRELVPLLTRRTRAMHDFLARQASAGVQPWTACGKPATATPGRLMPTTPKPVKPSWPPRWSVDTRSRRVPGTSACCSPIFLDRRRIPGERSAAAVTGTLTRRGRRPTPDAVLGG